jgi:GNAT superfamily N-acetyltransferase
MKAGSFNIIKERFTESEALAWQSEARKSAFLLGYNLKDLLSFKNVYKVYHGQDFIGSAFNLDFGQNWTELSGFIIKEDYRGQGLGGQLFKLLYAEAVDRGRNLYVVTRNPVMKKSMIKYDFETSTDFFSLPREIQLYTMKSIFNRYRLSQGLKKGFLVRSGQPFFAYKKIPHPPRSGARKCGITNKVGSKTKPSNVRVLLLNRCRLSTVYIG